MAAPSFRQGQVISALNASLSPQKRMPESSCDAITTASANQVHPFPMRIELVAWFGNFFLIAGQFRLGRKHWCAPWICNVGNALYLVYSAEEPAWALFAMTAVALVIMVRCAILWSHAMSAPTRQPFTKTPTTFIQSVATRVRQH